MTRWNTSRGSRPSSPPPSPPSLTPNSRRCWHVYHLLVLLHQPLLDVHNAFPNHRLKHRLRALLRVLQVLRVLQTLLWLVMRSLMITTGKMSSRASTRTNSKLISHLVVLRPTFAAHLRTRWYVMMTMLLN